MLKFKNVKQIKTINKSHKRTMMLKKMFKKQSEEVNNHLFLLLTYCLNYVVFTLHLKFIHYLYSLVPELSVTDTCIIQ